MIERPHITVGWHSALLKPMISERTNQIFTTPAEHPVCTSRWGFLHSRRKVVMEPCLPAAGDQSAIASNSLKGCRPFVQLTAGPEVSYRLSGGLQMGQRFPGVVLSCVATPLHKVFFPCAWFQLAVC